MMGCMKSLMLCVAGLASITWLVADEPAKDDPKTGAGPQAPWRILAKWDEGDEASTADIHKFTTAPQYITPMVSYVPKDAKVPSPKDVLGYIAGAADVLTKPQDTIRYFKALADAS